MPGLNSPYGIQVDSPDQRQWISRLSMGSIRRMASMVCGAADSQRAVKWRSSPTVIARCPIARRIRGQQRLGNTLDALDGAREPNDLDPRPRYGDGPTGGRGPCEPLQARRR